MGRPYRGTTSRPCSVLSGPACTACQPSVMRGSSSGDPVGGRPAELTDTLMSLIERENLQKSRGLTRKTARTSGIPGPDPRPGDRQGTSWRHLHLVGLLNAPWLSRK